MRPSTEYQSPILSFALKVLAHAIECYADDQNSFKKTISVLHLAQAVELTLKAAIVKRNKPIYNTDGKTLGWQDAADRLAAEWHVDGIDIGKKDKEWTAIRNKNIEYDRLPNLSSIEFLFDERNAVQHRYGSIDKETISFFFDSTLEFISEIISRDFDFDLHVWLYDNVSEDDRKKASPRLVNSTDSTKPSDAAILGSDKRENLRKVFDKYEEKVLTAFGYSDDRAYGEKRDTMDLSIKALSNNPRNSILIPKIPPKYKSIRDLTGDEAGTSEELDSHIVKDYFELMDNVFDIVSEIDPEKLQFAREQSEAHVKGSRIWGETGEK